MFILVQIIFENWEGHFHKTHLYKLYKSILHAWISNFNSKKSTSYFLHTHNFTRFKTISYILSLLVDFKPLCVRNLTYNRERDKLEIHSPVRFISKDKSKFIEGGCAKHGICDMSSLF